MQSAGRPGAQASKYSIAKERVLQKLGAHEKSKDQTYYESKEKITSLEGYCADISTVLNLWFSKVCELSTVSVSLAKVWVRVYNGTNERMEDLAHAYCKEQENIRNKKIPMLAEKIQTFTEAINNYRASVDMTKEAMESRRKLQLSFDHYSSKFATLKGNQEKNRTAGKLETLKQRERFERNLQKLGDAKQLFLKANQTVIKTLHHHWESRFGFLDDLFKQVIANETMFFEAFAKNLRSTKPVLVAAIKKPLPKPTPAPSQAEINELNDKAKYGNQRLFETDGKTEDSVSTVSSSPEDNPEEGEHLPNTVSPRDSKLGSIMGKAKNLFGKKKDLSLEPGKVPSGDLAHKQKKNLSLEPIKFTNELTLDEGKLESEYGTTTESGLVPRKIDPKDPFAMFDSTASMNKRTPRRIHARVCSTPVPCLSNPFSSSGKEKLSNSIDFDPWNGLPKTTPLANSEDPFADVPLSTGNSQGPFDGPGTAAEVSDPFSTVDRNKSTPNPFTEEESEADLRQGEPSPDPFATLFNLLVA